MVNPWVRLHREALHNPKIVLLSDRQHRFWHNLLLVVDDEGRLPAFRELSCHVRMSLVECEQLVGELVENGLVDLLLAEGPARYRLHDWDAHQFKSDSSVERVRKHRETKKKNGATARNGYGNGEVTPSESESDTDTDKKISSKFGFSGKVSRALEKRAEGLGLDVAELARIIADRKPKKPGAYFVTLCANRLAFKLPAINDSVLRAALYGKGDAYALVCQALLELSP